MIKTHPAGLYEQRKAEMSKRKAISPRAQKSPQYPWYDDCIEVVKQKRTDTEAYSEDRFGNYNTPRKLYDYLNEYIWKQEDTKKSRLNHHVPLSERHQVQRHFH